MVNEIEYKGYTANNSDYACSDGELAAIMGLVPDGLNRNNGAILSPVQKSKTLFKLQSENSTVLFVHRGDRYTNYIVVDTGNTPLDNGNNLYRGAHLYWTTNGKDLKSLFELKIDSGLHQVTAIGNTLILLTTSGIQYLLWEQNKTSYKLLGSDIPSMPIRFGLQGTLERGEKMVIDYLRFGSPDKTTSGSIIKFKEILNDNKKSLRLKVFDDVGKKYYTDTILGSVNKFIAEHYERNGKFIYPFFVRYAYRLYDGSLTKHSAPILMLPSTSCSLACIEDGIKMYRKDNQIYVQKIGGSYTSDVESESVFDFTYRIVGMACDLDYRLIDGAQHLSKLRDWKDIVKAVEIYVSAPIYTYNQNGDIEYLNITPLTSPKIKDIKSVCRLTNASQPSSYYSEWDWYSAYSRVYENPVYYPDADILYKASVEIPRIPINTLIEKVKACRDFYLLKSINIDELAATEQKKIDIDENFFKTLVNRERMTDDYDSHDKKTAKNAVIYNQRLNLIGLTKKPFNGFTPDMASPVLDGSITGASRFNSKACAYVYIKQAGLDIVVKSEEVEVFNKVPFYYFYYPNADAYKAIIYVKGAWENGNWNGYAERYFELPLESHIGLNGAFWFGNFDMVSESKFETFNLGVPVVSENNTPTIDIKNKIYTSKPNNPFVFPVLGINSVGVGEIYGISTAAKALSEGQFGQFPLYAFTSDGVWALEVASNGAYSARQPITRDVCVDKDSITQIDSAVLFATERGIMLLSGAQSTCISDVLDGEVPFALNTLPHGEDIVRLADLQDNQFEYVRFKDYIKDSGMIYDYSHQRIILFNPTKAYAYVYSLNTKMWGITESSIVHGVNSYPQALAMNSDGSLTDLSSYDNAEETKVLFVTRPLKFGAANVLKTIESVIQRGRFTNGNIKTVLYGSRNLETWSLVWSSEDHYLRGFSGSPYKYFRIVGFGVLSIGQSLDGASVSLRGRLNNQLR